MEIILSILNLKTSLKSQIDPKFYCEKSTNPGFSIVFNTVAFYLCLGFFSIFR